ncbi:LOW QUALITY PROTEIN: hypothetical protein BC938DRAFT_483875 [Jimgerdemannia flammicorona]|uniref:Nucleophile aminohydrolase n=1 Tax=Jimgerdemannia flammicorona TaxID=994334 RepID=A0A433QB11_9FUNG|nr:LOW QUALITY PROTEIN: hypothetical protein BC938DRAFT_483875 [Jimgerdemannia flammicorona]
MASCVAVHVGAGYGSNLTLHGAVECDASIMEGCNGRFGAIGAVPGIRNPISVAKGLVDESSKGLMTLGRIPPMSTVVPLWLPCCRQEHLVIEHENHWTFPGFWLAMAPEIGHEITAST